MDELSPEADEKRPLPKTWKLQGGRSNPELPGRKKEKQVCGIMKVKGSIGPVRERGGGSTESSKRRVKLRVALRPQER